KNCLPSAGAPSKIGSVSSKGTCGGSPEVQTALNEAPPPPGCQTEYWLAPRNLTGGVPTILPLFRSMTNSAFRYTAATADTFGSAPSFPSSMISLIVHL